MQAELPSAGLLEGAGLFEFALLCPQASLLPHSPDFPPIFPCRLLGENPLPFFPLKAGCPTEQSLALLCLLPALTRWEITSSPRMYHLETDSKIYVSSPAHSPGLQTYMFNSLPGPKGLSERIHRKQASQANPFLRRCPHLSKSCHYHPGARDKSTFDSSLSLTPQLQSPANFTAPVSKLEADLFISLPLHYSHWSPTAHHTSPGSRQQHPHSSLCADAHSFKRRLLKNVFTSGGEPFNLGLFQDGLGYANPFVCPHSFQNECVILTTKNLSFWSFD